MDVASNIKGISVGIVLKGPSDIIIDQVLKFEFTASNNQDEYDTLIAGMILALEMGATRLKAKNDSQLVANQVSGHY